MSESTARAERRALRRVVGPELLSFTEDTTQAIRTLQAGITTITQQFAADSASIHSVLDQTIDEVRLQRAQLDKCERAAAQSINANTNLNRRLAHPEDVIARGLFGRLRWLFTGR